MMLIHHQRMNFKPRFIIDKRLWEKILFNFGRILLLAVLQVLNYLDCQLRKAPNDVCN